jgi:hypothetical protein
MKEDGKELDQETADLYAQIAGEVFQEGAPVVPENEPVIIPTEKKGEVGGLEPPPKQEPPPKEKKEEVDPWEGVNPGLRAAFESISQKMEGMTKSLETVTQLDERVKQAERRVGGLNNQLRDLKVTADKQPTQEEISKALENKKNLDEFIQDFPVHEKGIRALAEGVIDEKLKGIQMPDLAAFRTELKGEFDKELTDLQKVFAITLLNSHYPDRLTIVKSPKFLGWLDTQDAETKGWYSSWSALDGLKLLDKFTGKNRSVDLENILQERQERLDDAATLNRTKTPVRKQKTEAEFTREEIYAQEAKKIWSK